MMRQRGGQAVAAALTAVVLVVVPGVAGVGGMAGAAGATPGPDVRLAGAPPVLPPGVVVTGPTDAAATVTAEVTLKPRDPAALDAFVTAVSTPGSPDYHRYLQPGQFAAEFGPTPATIASTRTWLASKGLLPQPTTADGLAVPVTAPVSTLERAFGVSMVDTRSKNGRMSRFATSAPTVPAALAPAVVGVMGLSTVARPEPQIVPTTGPAAANGVGGARSAEGHRSVPPTAHAGPVAQCSGAGGSGGYTADQIASAYGIGALYNRGLTGAGLTVGIYELEPFTMSDITTYKNCFSPPLTNTVTSVPVSGGATSGQSGEAALDIEDVAGLAPGAAIKVYEGPQAGSGPVDTYRKMVTDDTARVLTTSWGICEPELATSFGQQAAESSIFAEAAAQGQTMIAAAGDAGSTDCYDPFVNPPDTDTSVTVDDPADQPNVTGVGGSSLLGTAPTEAVWNNGYGSGGGGVSSNFAAPPWQTGPGVGAQTALSQCAALGRTSCREVPDVAASADPAHGYAIFYGGHWGVYGGTSAASPVWAAMTAVIDQSLATPSGLINPVLYAAGACADSPFNDVNSGSNAWIPPSLGHYPSTANFDVASGWGSANASRLAASLASPPICPVVTSVNPARGAAAGGGTVTLTGTNFSNATSVLFGGTPAVFGVRSSTSISAIAPGGPSGSTVNITVVGPGGTSRAVPVDQYTYSNPGYWLVASDGGIFTFGHTAFLGSTGALRLDQPVVGMSPSADDGGYWLVAADGGIFAFGDARFAGSTGGLHLNKPIVGMAATTDGRGYWLVASDGGIFSFGDAAFYGSTGSLHLNKPIVGMAATPDGRGYWLVAADGGIFAFGDARFYGSTGAFHLNKPIVGMAATPDGRGYWLVAADGGIFAFGGARFSGSTGALHLNKPIVGMTDTPDGRGYWLVAADGGIFSFGDARFYGSTGALALNRPIVGMASG